MGLFGKGPVVKLKVEGMNCGHCSAKVEQTLQDMDGVKKAEVDLETKTATVTLKKEGSQDPEALAAAVARVGFTAKVQ